MSIFRLQQFSIEQSQSGMKVCSDSLLFGAMIPFAGAQKVLDIGTGTGLLSLMQGQKAQAVVGTDPGQYENAWPQIVGVELTSAAAEEARKNFAASPWPGLFEVYQQDIQGFAEVYGQSAKDGFDLIICNPPFFAKHSKTQASQTLRQTARHTDSLSFAELCLAINRLISPQGRVYLLLPIMVLDEFYATAKDNQLYPQQQVTISESEQHQAKLAMVMLSRDCAEKIGYSSIVKFIAPNVHSPECENFLSPYLLRYG